jgi:transcriptional regulator with XRE-family HTH domain
MSAANGHVRIGARLRHAREASRQSLSDVAARCGVSKGFISRIERDEASPSVASLVALCDAVGLTMADLFAIPETTLVRHASRPSLSGLPKSADVVDTLITPPRGRHVTVLESTVAPGAAGGEQLYTLPSECEVCFVLEGEVDVDVDGEGFRLGPGDALTFGAAVPHTWRNASDTEGARILWILAPALPDPRKEAA